MKWRIKIMNKYKKRRIVAAAIFIALCAGSGCVVGNAIVNNEPRNDSHITAAELPKSTVLTTEAAVMSTHKDTTANLSTTTEVVTTTAATSTQTTTITTTTTTENIDDVAISISTDIEVHNDDMYNLSQYEIDMLAALVELEGSTDPYESKKAICSTVINRSSLEDRDVISIISDPNQYSVAYSLSSCVPSQDSIDAVYDVIINGSTLPIYVTSFRANYYHSWGDQTPYTNIGNTYFSYSAEERSLYE